MKNKFSVTAIILHNITFTRKILIKAIEEAERTGAYPVDLAKEFDIYLEIKKFILKKVSEQENNP